MGTDVVGLTATGRALWRELGFELSLALLCHQPKQKQTRCTVSALRAINNAFFFFFFGGGCFSWLQTARYLWWEPGIDPRGLSQCAFSIVQTTALTPSLSRDGAEMHTTPVPLLYCCSRASAAFPISLPFHLSAASFVLLLHAAVPVSKPLFLSQLWDLIITLLI